MPEEKKKQKGLTSILGMSPEEIQEWLTKNVKKVPFMKKVVGALEGSKKRIEGKEEE